MSSEVLEQNQHHELPIRYYLKCLTPRLARISHVFSIRYELLAQQGGDEQDKFIDNSVLVSCISHLPFDSIK